MLNIEKTIEEQNQTIKEEIEKLYLLKAFDITDPITEDYFHQLCETPLKNNREAMCEIVHKIFPTATDIKCGANYVHCKIGDFNILVPTSSTKGVEVEIDYIPLNPDESKYSSCYEEDHNIKFLTDYIELIDTNGSWYRKAVMRNNHRYRKWFLPIWWFCSVVPKDKKENRNRDWYVNLLNKKLEYKRNSYESQLKKYNDFMDKIEAYFVEVEPVIKQYTDKISRHQNNWYSKDFFEEMREKIKQRHQETV